MGSKNQIKFVINIETRYILEFQIQLGSSTRIDLFLRLLTFIDII